MGSEIKPQGAVILSTLINAVKGSQRPKMSGIFLTAAVARFSSN